jgi:hypothetical protein
MLMNEAENRTRRAKLAWEAWCGPPVRWGGNAGHKIRAVTWEELGKDTQELFGRVVDAVTDDIRNHVTDDVRKNVAEVLIERGGISGFEEWP